MPMIHIDTEITWRELISIPFHFPKPKVNPMAEPKKCYQSNYPQGRRSKTIGGDCQLR